MLFRSEVFTHPWFIATLFDAYWAFIAFYVWVAWKEQSAAARVGWFVAIIALGNIAMAAYLLRELFAVPAAGPLDPSGSTLHRLRLNVAVDEAVIDSAADALVEGRVGRDLVFGGERLEVAGRVGGSVDVRNTEPGAEFRVRLPLAGVGEKATAI